RHTRSKRDWSSDVCSSDLPFVLPHNDFIFSSNVSASLIKTGYENFFMEGNLYNPAYHFMIPYHYFEIWLNSFIVFFTGANNLLRSEERRVGKECNTRLVTI